MDNDKDNANVEQELADLKKELANFQKDKERIRAIIGSVGGIPKFHSKLFNGVLIVATGLCLLISIMVNSTPVRLLMIELASAAVSVKIIYLIHCQMRVNHFKLWVLSSIEWRLNELTRLVRKIKEE
jgi:F0F1-type ATP synthase assembly protein I